MQKILVTGSSGMLGKEIIRKFKTTRRFELFGVDMKNENVSRVDHYYKTDLTDFDNLTKILEKIKPDIIVHCAAIVKLDFCETNKKLTEKLHVSTSRILAAYKPSKTRIIYISTDSVFNGEKGNYYENDAPAPLNNYASSKYRGELAVIKENTNSLIIRTNIYGLNNPTGNSLIEWALSELSSGRSIVGFNNIIFNPVYTGQLADVILQIIDKYTISNIINIVSDRAVSKYEFLKLLAAKFHLDQALVLEGNSDKFRLKPERPKNTTLNNSLLYKLTGIKLSLESGFDQLVDDFNL